MSKKVSMKDIATQLGVSTALVSYVLNGKLTDRINADTAKMIKDLALELQYKPNEIAKSLKNSKTYTIGLIVADISNFFYSYIAGFIEDEVNKKGYNVIFGSAYEDPLRFKSLLELMVSRQVDGLIVAIPDGAEDCIEYIQRLSMPCVLIDREFPRFKDLNTVCLDNYKSSEMVVEKFYSMGCKRMAAIGLDNSLFHLQERGRGFLETAESRVDKENVFLSNISEDALPNEVDQVLRKLLYEDKVDAICFFTNKIAMVALPILLSSGIKIPEDLAIICYDEAEAYKLFPYPMSYVRQPLKEMSVEAVKYLLDEKPKSPMGTKRLQAELVDMKGY